MCKLVSLVLSSEQAYYLPNKNSHEDIIEAYGLKDTLNVRGRPNLLRVEVYPDDDNWTKPFTEWNIHFNQTLMPEWFDAYKAQCLIIQKMEQWYNECVIQKGRTVDKIEAKHICLCLGNITLIKDAEIEIIAGNAVIDRVEGNSHINSVRDQAIIKEAAGNTLIDYLANNARIDILRDNSRIQHTLDKSFISTMSGYSRIDSAHDFSRIEQMQDNSCIRCLEGKSSVRHMKDASWVAFVSVKAVVKSMRDFSVVRDCNGTINKMTGHSVLHNLAGSSLVKKMEDNAAVLSAAQASEVFSINNDAFVRYAGGLRLRSAAS